VAAIAFDGATYDCGDEETVLDALLRQGVEIPHSCKLGVCLSCLLKAEPDQVPAAAREGLRETLREQGYFLACQCQPDQSLSVSLGEESDVFGRAKVVRLDRLAPRVCRVVLKPAAPLTYRAGQFVNLRRHDGLIRSYSLASVPHLDSHLELQIKRLPDGQMSNWIFDGLAPGDTLDIQGPNGCCYYIPGRPKQSLLLIGNGTGLAPLIGIARDALSDGHGGSIRLYHGTREADGLYLRAELEALAAEHGNFEYFPCLSGDSGAPGCRLGRAESVAFSDLAELQGWRVFLCGYPPMVHSAKRHAYLAGAALDDILTDPFELRELRQTPRD
jgi:NAD(P)H-flavin reductase